MVDNELLYRELLETFRMEAQDHLGVMSTLLVSLENESEAAERRRIVETIFRRMHTLKGAAHAVNLAEVAKTCQELEDLLAGVKRGELDLDAQLFDRLHDDVDALARRFVDGRIEPTQPAAPAKESALSRDAAVCIFPSATEASRTAVPIAAPAATVPRSDGATPPPAAQGGARTEAPGSDARPVQHERPHQSAETVRVSTRLLESLLLQAEELVQAKLTAAALAEELSGLAGEVTGRRNSVARAIDLCRETAKKAQQGSDAAKLSAALNESAEFHQKTESRLRTMEKAAAKHVWSLTGMVDPLLDDVRKLHLLPFSSLTDPFAKLVRDLGRELDKEAELVCTGCEIEVDRRILAELKEPLLHLVRNVMDHGLEKPAERRAKGKKERGRITIEVRLQDANLAEVTVSDDGRGIDLARVKNAALRMELATAEALDAMSDADALQLVFESGVSTSAMITSLSGRGVGLAIVREALEKLGGHAAVSTTPGAGTTFRLSLPLSFAMMRALLVEVGGRRCFIPAANVELATRVPFPEIRSVENRDTVLIGGSVVALANLSRLLELGDRIEDAEGVRSLVVLNAAEKRIAFAVDCIAEVQEILVKPLGSQLSRVRNVAGATVLGNGTVVPVLNVGDVFRSALLAAGAAQTSAPAPSARAKRVSVLVVEDSITSRTLLKNILEASGFLVQTAVDGMDALALLRTESFDVVVSDVEMPRMDGFELTAAIRADRRMEGLPVILVTGLESRTDRERGIDVGANAYVVKSSFDQGSLVDVIHKLA